ncbi:MAG: invasion associated locus B family protein [Parvibaculaceae bacterium]|nr:invasion associated locus B family protein [Parvibaculaceae bacterium]
MHNWQRVVGALILAISTLTFTQSAFAAGEAAKTFGSWKGICSDVKAKDGKPVKLCQVLHEIRAKNEKKSLIALLGISKKDNAYIASVLTPLFAVLPQGVGLQIDASEKGFGGPYQICTPAGCQASLALSPEVIGKLKAGNEVKILYVDARKGPLAIPASLSGITAALKWLDAN